MTPQFRQAIFQLPLCDTNFDTPSTFLSGNRRQMIFNLQRLFVLLQDQDSRAITTEELTKSFGWGSHNEHSEQHDV
jgi:uncharacterized UBP type Zn finger protein